MFVNTLEHFFGTTDGSSCTFDPRPTSSSRDRADRHSRVAALPISSSAWSCRWRPSPHRRRRDRRVRDRQHAQRGDLGRRDVRRALRTAVAQPPGNRTDAGQERKMPVGRKVVPLIVIALAITYPFYVGKLFTIPVFGPAPSVDTAVNMIVFMMMAVGLNIVVGYAGLLDLGYVAFYAIGAYTAAWFASLQFPTINFHLGRSASTRTCRDPHHRLGAAGRRGSPHRDDRRPDRPPDPAPARRLPRDRHARLRRDHAPDRPQRERPLQHGLQPDRRPAGDHADRLAGLRQQARPRDGRLPAGELPDRRERERLLLGRARSCSGSRSSARCACATRASAAPGSRSARTRSPPRRWASR